MYLWLLLVSILALVMASLVSRHVTCVRRGRGCHLGWSNRVDTTPSRIPIWEPRPRESSIMKKRADQKGAPGILVNTSAITMKANPVPWAESSSSFTSEQFLRSFSGCSLLEVIVNEDMEP